MDNYNQFEFPKNATEYRDTATQDMDMPLTEFVDIKYLERLIQSVSDIYNVSATLIDVEGYEIVKILGCSEHCKPFLESGESVCFSRMFDLVTQSGFIKNIAYAECPDTSFKMAGIPLIADEKHLASLVIGQSRTPYISQGGNCEDENACAAEGEFEVMCDNIREMISDIEHICVLKVKNYAQIEHNSQLKIKKAKLEKLHKLLLNELLMTEMSDKGSIDTFLKTIGQGMDFSRAYMVEKKENGVFSIVSEWCSPGCEPVPREYRTLHFNRGVRYRPEEVTIYDSADKSDGKVPEYFAPAATGTKSSVHMPLFENDTLTSIIILDECERLRIYFKEDIDYLNSVLCAVSSTFRKARSYRAHKQIDDVRAFLKNTVVENINDGIKKNTETYQENEKIIEKFAYYDEERGLPNLQMLGKDLSRIVLEHINNNINGALIYIDLDDFSFICSNQDILEWSSKAINEIASFLREFPCEGKSVYHLSADEFTIIIENIEGGDLSELVEKIWGRFQQPWVIDNCSYNITASIAVVRIPLDGTTADMVMRNADFAMRASKSGCKNTVSYYRGGLAESLEQRLELEKWFDSEDDFSSFRLYYQPIMDLREDKVAGVEALIRWVKEDGTVIPANRIMPILEAKGRMNEVGLWVLKTALKEAKHLPDDVYISVNLSIVQLQNPNFIGDVLMALLEAEIEPERLMLDVSENMAAYDVQFSNSQLNLLRLNGVRVSLDNYGAEYSDLTKLPQMPYDITNIDMMYVKNMQHDEFSDAVVRTFIDIAHSAGFTVCSEGIECQEQYLDLKEYGCDLGQGYYFSKPVPMEQLKEFMKKYEEPSDTPGGFPMIPDFPVMDFEFDNFFNET